MGHNIQLVAYRINKLEFKFHEGIKQGTKFNIKPKFECKVGRNEKTLFINYSVKVNEDLSSPVPFDLHAEMFATFNLKNEVDQQAIATEVMEILFPYLRSAVANVMFNCNVPPYFLPLIEFKTAPQAPVKTDDGILS